MTGIDMWSQLLSGSYMRKAALEDHVGKCWSGVGATALEDEAKRVKMFAQCALVQVLRKGVGWVVRTSNFAEDKILGTEPVLNP